MNAPLEMTAAYFDGKLNAEQVAELEAWLREDPERAKAFVRQAMLDNHLGELLHEENVQDLAPDLSDDSQFTELLRSLDGTADPVDFTEVIERGREQQLEEDPGSLSAHDYAAAGSYALRMALTSKAAKKLYACTAVAAVVLLVLTLFNPFASDAPDTFADLDSWDDDDTSTPPAVAPGITPVATLTATHNTQWAERALVRGSDLHAGQRLTLTAGFAEITTNRGAVAIIEAPATIELLDNDNALRLHTGKLVGICETESSKGFLVRTPHMDITDIGTRFAVDVSPDDMTSVHVLDGEVRASHVLATPTDEPVRLVTGQSARGSGDTPTITAIEQGVERFAAVQTRITPLASTGLGLSRGEIDPNWTIAAFEGKALDQPLPLTVGGFRGQLLVAQDDPQACQWLTASSLPVPKGQNTARYVFQASVNVPDTVDLTRAQLVLRGTADNQVLSVRVNQTLIDLDKPKTQADGEIADIPPLSTFTLDTPLVRGENTLQITVLDGPVDEVTLSQGLSGSLVGLFLELSLIERLIVSGGSELP